MKRNCLLLTVGLLAIGLAVTGCGKKVEQAAEVARVAQDAKDGNFTVKGDDDKEVKVETNKIGGESGKVATTDASGKTTTTEYGKDAVKQEDVGVDFYPGAEVKIGTKDAASGKGGKAGALATVQLVTSDPLEKVAKFYKDRYAKGSAVLDTSQGVIITFGSGKGVEKTISITGDKAANQTVILIVSGQ
jgi:hypothetical protein